MPERHLERRRSWYADPSTEIVQRPRDAASAAASMTPELVSVKRLRPSRRSSNGLPSSSPTIVSPKRRRVQSPRWPAASLTV
jgi:hypothetical protein